MYTIKAYVDGTEYTLHDSRVKALTLGGKPYFEVGDNINGSASFSVYPNHPHYDKVKKLTTDIIIYRDDEPEFYGRVLYDDEDFSGTKKVFVEGELAFLCDSIQRPKVYHNISVKAYVQDLIDIHNAQVEERKQFVVGRVTVKDSNNSLYRYSNYEDTRTVFKEKLTNRLGGHLVIRHVDGLRVLDYLADEDYYTKNDQGIRFGKNLLDFSKNMDASDLITCVIPLGAKTDEEDQDPSLEAISDQRITIASINGGVDYVTDDNAVREYGKIYKTVTWDDVSLPENLKKKGEEYLKSSQFEKMVLELKAVDLNLKDDSFQQFGVGNKIQCTSTPNGLDKEFPLTKKKTYITSFKDNTVTLGDETSSVSYTSSNRQNTAQIEETIKSLPSKSEILQEALRSAQDLINKQVASGYAVHTPNEFIVADDKEYKDKAKNLWRWGLGGLAHYSQGYDGPIDGIALTMDGKINGKMLLANSVVAESIDVSYRNEVESTIVDTSDKAKLEAVEEAKSYADNIKNTINNEIDDVSNKVSDMDEQLDYIASDGIITEAEKAAINKILQTVQKEKEEADRKYNEVYQNTYLAGTAKTNLASKYGVAYGKTNTSKYNILIQSVNTVLSSTTAAQVRSNMSAYKTAYASYATAVAEYKCAIETAINSIAENYADVKTERAKEAAQSYADGKIKVVKETIENSISNLENKISLSVRSVKETVARKNYIVGGEQETLSLSNFSLSGSTGICKVEKSEFLNKNVFKLTFSGTGSITLTQSLGTLEAGNYKIAVEAAYPEGARYRPSYIQYGFSGNKSTAYLSGYKADEFQTFSKAVKIVKASKNVAITVYGNAGNILYITDVRCLRDMQELFDDLSSKVDVEVGKVSASVAEVFENSLHNYCSNGSFSDSENKFAGWSRSNTTHITQTTFSNRSCAKIQNTASTYNISWYQKPWEKKGNVTVRFKAACASEDASTARIRVTIDGKAFYTTAGELSSSWKQFEFTSYATPSYFYTYFYNYVANTTVYITDVEILGYMAAYAESKLTILKDSIESEVKRATEQEGALSSSIKQNAQNITSKVSKGDMGSYITQYYNNVIVAFNKNSRYIQINPGEIAVYNNGVESSKKRATFDESGNHFWRDNYYVGKIGTNSLKDDNSKKGFDFDLEWPGAYMTWAAQDYSGASTYTMKWTYVQKNKGWSDYTGGRLHAGCDIDMHNWTLRNVNWPDGAIDGTFRFVQVLSVRSDGTLGEWSNNCMMQFKNGILIKGTWYGG